MRFVTALAFFGALAAPAPAATLANDYLKVEISEHGIAQISNGALRFRRDAFAITLDGQTLRSEALALVSSKAEGNAESQRAVYRYSAPPYEIELVYELRPEWKFVSKQLLVKAPPGKKFRINSIELLDAALENPVRDVYMRSNPRPNLQTRDYAAFLRFDRSQGLMAAAQNPFLEIQHGGNTFSIRYQPEMDWSGDYGEFASDRAILAPYRLTGRTVPAQMIPEWRLSPPAEAGATMDEAEVEAFTGAVRSLLVYQPQKPVNIFVGWCVNDYQIDISTAADRAEYKRVLDRAAELGSQYVLFAPTNSAISRRLDAADDWSWENLLWLGLGQKIRRNEWTPRTDPLPASVGEMLDYAKSKNLKLVAYVYPVMPFTQNPEWLISRGARKNASLGVRSFQDWLIDTLVAFYQRTGIGGYAFDHTFLNFEGTSRYAQWWGWRRVLETLRERIPEIVVDGRQAYQLYGPWSWLAGSYPHPTSTDEQPESFVPFPDLHFDRVSADRQRYTAYRYRNLEFAPSEIVPGFITHQTPRNNDAGKMPLARVDGPLGPDAVPLPFRARDWDYLGWRYSLISSIATAGWNNVINMIPARDPEEYRSFSGADQAWFRHWLDWTDQHKEFLRRTKTIIGQPALGKVDGTAAIIGREGFIFLFNPNGRKRSADFTLDESIGLSAPGTYLLRQLYPRDGILVGKPRAGVWNYGDAVSLPLDGASAMVLQLLPAPATITEPVVFNVPGRIRRVGRALELTGASGEVGTMQDVVVWFPPGERPRTVTVNGRPVPVSFNGDCALLSLRFDGAPFAHMQQVGDYDPGFSGGAWSSSFTIPQRVFAQLAARRKAWPIPWTAEDYKTSWLVPERLLLFVQIGEPDDQMPVTMTIDGQAVELQKAYSSVRPNPRSFVGFYADVSKLAADREHRVELSLPRLKPGQFQGLFFENVETEYTVSDARP